MKTLLRLLKLIQDKKHYKKLLVPGAFFIIELVLALILNWQLFGEHFEFNETPGIQQASVHNPLIVIKAVHSDRLTLPYGESLSQDMPLIQFYSERYVVKALCFLASLMFAYLGIFIAVLWIKRFRKRNHLNVSWWQWPTACLGAHAVLYLIASSNLVM